MQPEAAIILIEKPVTARRLLAQDITSSRINLLAHGVGFSWNNDLAQETFALSAGLYPHVTLALSVVSESKIGDSHFVRLYEIEPVSFKLVRHNWSPMSFAAFTPMISPVSRADRKST